MRDCFAFKHEGLPHEAKLLLLKCIKHGNGLGRFSRNLIVLLLNMP